MRIDHYSQFKDFDDFCKQTGMDTFQAYSFLNSELIKVLVENNGGRI